MKRGVSTVADLRARSVVDAVTHCWHWDGAKVKGHPRIWTLDLDAMDKRVMSGPRAVWFIAHGTPLHGLVAYMGCWTLDCVCPVHARRGTRAEVNAAVARAGLLPDRRGDVALVAAAARARAAAGHVDTPVEVVRAVRKAAGTASGRALAARFGLSQTVAQRILRGQTYRGVGA